MFIQFFHLLGNIDTFCVSELMEDGINENQEVLRSLEEEVQYNRLEMTSKELSTPSLV